MDVQKLEVKPGQLADFGEKLGGARKDKAAQAKADLDKFADVLGEDLMKKSFAEIFPLLFNAQRIPVAASAEAGS